MSAVDLQMVDCIDEVDATAWNRLAGPHPFLRHEFLAALERHECVGEHFGWFPRHVVAYGESGELLGAMPLYLKHNSYGEFVFDWAWADAYRRHGLAYYPKLVSAIPYTPATGSRLLVTDGDESLARRLVEFVSEYADRQGVSSIHWLFPDAADVERLERQGLLLRADCHFHWSNPGYRDFQDYLEAFSAQKRKKIKQERRRVRDAGIEVEIYSGLSATAEHWTTFADFYRSTFLRKGGIPTLNEGFFREVAATLGEQVILVLARHGKRHVAGALAFASDDALFGRHWGAVEQFNSLHFELCYYQGIEYCIHRNLARFEPGVQGEHKVSRGFFPTLTWSAHWIHHPGFRRALDEALERERRMVEGYCEELRNHFPLKPTASDGVS